MRKKERERGYNAKSRMSEYLTECTSNRLLDECQIWCQIQCKVKWQVNFWNTGVRIFVSILSDRLPEYLSDRMPGYTSIHLSHRMPKCMPLGMPEYMSDTRSEYTSGTMSVGGDHSRKMSVGGDHSRKIYYVYARHTMRIQFTYSMLCKYICRTTYTVYTVLTV